MRFLRAGTGCAVHHLTATREEHDAILPLVMIGMMVLMMAGHSQIALTMNTYTHVLPELKRDAANRMDRMLNAALER
jgi:integrase